MLVNAFTVDVEEWFHICGVAELANPQRWPALPSRDCPHDRRGAVVARSLRRPRHVLRARMGRRAPSGAGRSHPSGRTRDCEPRLASPARLRARPRALRCRPAIVARRPCGRGRARRARVSRARVVDQRSGAMGARRADSRRLHRRFQSRAHADRRQPGIPTRAASPADLGRIDRRSAPVRGPPSGPAHAVRRWLGPADGATRAPLARDCPPQRRRGAGDAVAPPVGARPRPAARRSAPRQALRTLLPPGRPGHASGRSAARRPLSGTIGQMLDSRPELDPPPSSAGPAPVRS